MKVNYKPSFHNLSYLRNRRALLMQSQEEQDDAKQELYSDEEILNFHDEIQNYAREAASSKARYDRDGLFHFLQALYNLIVQITNHTLSKQEVLYTIISWLEKTQIRDENDFHFSDLLFQLIVEGDHYQVLSVAAQLILLYSRSQFETELESYESIPSIIELICYPNTKYINHDENGNEIQTYDEIEFSILVTIRTSLINFFFNLIEFHELNQKSLEIIAFSIPEIARCCMNPKSEHVMFQFIDFTLHFTCKYHQFFSSDLAKEYIEFISILLVNSNYNIMFVYDSLLCLDNLIENHPNEFCNCIPQSTLTQIIKKCILNDIEYITNTEYDIAYAAFYILQCFGISSEFYPKLLNSFKETNFLNDALAHPQNKIHLYAVMLMEEIILLNTNDCNDFCHILIDINVLDILSNSCSESNESESFQVKQKIISMFSYILYQFDDIPTRFYIEYLQNVYQFIANEAEVTGIIAEVLCAICKNKNYIKEDEEVILEEMRKLASEICLNIDLSPQSESEEIKLLADFVQMVLLSNE